MSNPASYCLISPCRDEALHALRTLESVMGQSAPPALWVIINDGSTDGTGRILDQFAARYSCIRVLVREDRGGRSVGPGVIDAFYAGYETIDPRRFDYIAKLDMDVELPPRYFETLIAKMQKDLRIGTCSGKPYFRGRNGKLLSEGCGDETSVGMAKFYRRSCFEQIGGFVREVMWDGIDCHHCRMCGWIAASYDDPQLRFEHLRPMGSSHRGILTGRMRHGAGQHFMGTGLGYMTASSLFRMTRSPLLIGGLAIWWGYLRSMLAGCDRYDNADFRRFLRRYHRSCLWRGKAAATRLLNERQQPIWEAASNGPGPAMDHTARAT